MFCHCSTAPMPFPASGRSCWAPYPCRSVADSLWLSGGHAVCYSPSYVEMAPITVAWWVWLIAGVVLMVAELLLPSGFFLFLFGVGAVVTALLAATGLLSSFVAQGVVFIA